MHINDENTKSEDFDKGRLTHGSVVNDAEILREAEHYSKEWLITLMEISHDYIKNTKKPVWAGQEYKRIMGMMNSNVCNCIEFESKTSKELQVIKILMNALMWAQYKNDGLEAHQEKLEDKFGKYLEVDELDLDELEE